MNLRKVRVAGCGQDSSGTMTVSFEHGSEFSDYIRRGEFFEQLSDY
jgi:hypothetical protein